MGFWAMLGLGRTPAPLQVSRELINQLEHGRFSGKLKFRRSWWSRERDVIW